MKKVILATVLATSVINAQAATNQEVALVSVCSGSYKVLGDAANIVQADSSDIYTLSSGMKAWSRLQMVQMGLSYSVSERMTEQGYQKGIKIATETLVEAEDKSEAINTIINLCEPAMETIQRS